ncbi:class II aldolase/adducin family protein [Variovorax sp. J31P207]|uniref:class II aldolase/adducin family protein n=1 Tax=Variovorax sp. J31P207 TaxID=3053510 RepID=UPI0025784C6A|nr:class II aldolase/adducin family protein [Variovorax sp. J31P207]MDM0066921.1 class II aldolase/adducin family protein [Variovorax sp. J31P207]
MNAAPSDQRALRIAARALARHGLAHAYGHCSLRLDDGHFLVCASQPMGLIAPGDPGTVVPIFGALPAGVLGEVRLHQQIYQRQAHVNAVTRTMPPSLMTLGTARRTPRPRHGMGAYFGSGAALWDDPQLVRDDDRAAAVIDAMGSANAIVMRGNGVLVTSDKLAKAVVLTWYLEDAARIELAVLAAGLQDESVVLDANERRQRATDAGGIFERMWQYLAAGDPEINIQEESA